MVEELKIDTNLYSRQIGTFGLETMGKLVKMKCLIIGMRGLGVETAKNLILAGPQRVDMYDPTQVSISDLGSNFYLTQAHVGTTTRAEGSNTQLCDLNPHCKTDVIGEFQNDIVKNYSIIVITERFWNDDKIIEINNLCRENNIGFVLTENMGLASYSFLDYGPNFVVNDKDGEPTKSFIVVGIEQGEKPQVIVYDNKRHSYQDGDFVTFI